MLQDSPRLNDGLHAGTDIDELRARLREVSDLRGAKAVLGWDQSTYMPPGGATARGRQKALLSRIAHERFTDPQVGRLLDRLERDLASLPPDDDDACLVRVTRRDYDRATRLPPEFVAEISAHSASAYQAWTQARPANDFRGMADHLERGLDLSRRWSAYYQPHGHTADPLIDASDEGMTAEKAAALFSELRAVLVPMVKRIASYAPADDSCLHRHFPEPDQLDFSLNAAAELGYDLDRGRLDKTHHPFCTTFALGDVRITTRVRENDFSDAFFSTIHEAGHGLYEQGISAHYEGTPLGHGASAGVHESQSRLWENVVARSHGYWAHAYPRLQRAFESALGDIDLDTFYRAINKVQFSLIRTDADEVTYNLHVMLRFDLELALLEGRLAVKDLPDAWRARFSEDFGIVPPDDRDGVLQDVHWYAGLIGGGFQGYTIGNILSSQFFDAAVAAVPSIPSEIASGRFGGLRDWLTENVYCHGAKFAPEELVQRATGQPMTVAPYIRYLKVKFGDLHGLE